jgi:hypothetical protein
MKLLLATAFALALVQSPPARHATPAELEALLARYDALPAGPARDALEPAIDACAGQKYALHARLFWYRDIGEAETAARASHKPILSLRMLGRLDEDYSCANSRFFRVALYADLELSSFLRDNFVLHWSSERPVPQVTIDFGDGRVLHTTLAGNSAHYVLDSDGRPIDVLPGLYSAEAFRSQLELVLPLARSSPELDQDQRWQAIRRMHELHDAFFEVTPDIAASAALPTLQSVPGIVPAERIAATKSIAQMPLVSRVFPQADAASAGAAILDASSIALFEHLAPRGLTRGQLDLMRARFERSIAADTRNNERNLRPRIHALMADDDSMLEFEPLNAAIYSEIFLTPRSDAWLGLERPGVFDALPRN